MTIIISVASNINNHIELGCIARLVGDGRRVERAEEYGYYMTRLTLEDGTERFVGQNENCLTWEGRP